MPIRVCVSVGLMSLAVFATPALADETAPPGDFTVSGAVSAVSQYRFRGISQSDNKPAVEGSVLVSHASGFYVAAWASSAQAGNSAVDIGGSELDIYGGYTREIGGVTADLGVYGYLYPGASSGNYYEVYGSLAKTYGPITAKLGVNYAPPQHVFTVIGAKTRSNTYLFGELGGGIPGTPITLHSHLGHTGGGFDYTKPYLDYSVGATARWKALSFDLSLVGTNVSHADAARAPLAPSAFETWRAAKSVAVATVSFNF
ncbi:MAG: TorF family putative porin [Novosphingobium sp.]